jgi:hypothetical protein
MNWKEAMHAMTQWETVPKPVEFSEVVCWLARGECVRRRSWVDDSEYVKYRKEADGSLYPVDQRGIDVFFALEDFQATDWEIVKPRAPEYPGYPGSAGG